MSDAQADSTEPWLIDYVEGVALSGRNRPIQVQCSRGAEKMSVFIKMEGHDLAPTGLFCEFFGNVLARQFKILTPLPLLLMVDEDTARMINSAPVIRSVGKTIVPGMAVGCQDLGRAVLPPVSERLSDSQLDEAATIYAFDMLTHHFDRQTDNPNVLMARGHFVAIDFDKVFSFLYDIMPAPPWKIQQNTLYPHVFWESLRKERTGKLWDPILDAMMSVELDGLPVRNLPSEWEPLVARVRHHFDEVKGHRDEFRWELLRTLG